MVMMGLWFELMGSKHSCFYYCCFGLRHSELMDSKRVAGVSFALKVLIRINSYVGMWRLKGTVNGNFGSTSAADRDKSRS
jgi:hypothetical protein